MQTSNQNIVKAHSCALQVSHRASLNQYRAWLVLLKNAMPEMGDPSATTHKIRLADLWQRLGNEGNRNDAYLKNLLRGLVDVKVEWNILNKCKETEWGVASLLAGVRIRNGLLEYDYSTFLRERLHNPRMFALLNLSIVNRFTSKYSLALYCIAADYKGLNATPFIPIEKYRQLMGLDAGEYEDFRALNRRLIKEPLEEINRLSDLTINAEYVKECRRVVAVRFHVQKNPTWQPTPPPQVGLPVANPSSPLIAPTPESIAELPPPQAALLHRLLKFGIAEPQAREFLKTYDLARICQNLDLVEATLKRKIIENLPAYTACAIIKDFSSPQRAALAERKRKHLEALAAHDAFVKQSKQESDAALDRAIASRKQTGFADH
jgi:hypothetical protein